MPDPDLDGDITLEGEAEAKSETTLNAVPETVPEGVPEAATAAQEKGEADAAAAAAEDAPSNEAVTAAFCAAMHLTEEDKVSSPFCAKALALSLTSPKDGRVCDLRGPYTTTSLKCLLDVITEVTDAVFANPDPTFDRELHDNLSHLYMPTAAVARALPCIFSAMMCLDSEKNPEGLAAVAWNEIICQFITAFKDTKGKKNPALDEPFFLRIREARDVFYIRVYPTTASTRSYVRYSHTYGNASPVHGEAGVWATFRDLGSAFSEPLASWSLQAPDLPEAIAACISGMRGVAWLINAILEMLCKTINHSELFPRMRHTASVFSEILQPVNQFDHRRTGDPMVRIIQIFIDFVDQQALLRALSLA
jgi:hypothetical protein